MKKGNSINIEPSLREFFSILTAKASRNEALTLIASEGIRHFGEFITPGSLKLRDEVQINFIEILDQIIFELNENNDSGFGVRYYIIDDLYSRLSLTLEALVDIDKYLSNLKNRTLYYDDLIIIRNKKLSELIPLLISESEDITSLEKQIVKTLLYFSEKTGIEFFYNSFTKSSSGFAKSAALLGMRCSGIQGLNWTSIKEKANGCSGSIEYLENFNFDELSKNRLPETMEEMTFVLLYIEKEAACIKDLRSVSWILSVLNIVPSMNFENSWLNEVNISLSNILLNLDTDIVREVMKNESAIIMTVNFIDFLPRNIFNRLTGFLDMMGVEFIFNLNSMIEKGKKKIDSYNSNILTYLSWNTTQTY